MMNTIAGDYINLGTYRKTGICVKTPVWFAQQEQQLFVFSAANVGKVKRIRRDGTCRVAPCTVNGKLTGDWINAHAHLVSSNTDIRHAYASLKKKYGWKMTLLDFFSKLGGKINDRQFIRIELP